MSPLHHRQLPRCCIPDDQIISKVATNVDEKPIYFNMDIDIEITSINWNNKLTIL